MNIKLSAASLFLAITAVAGTALASDSYDVSVKSPSAKVNQRAVAKVSVAPKGAFHVNTEYPVKLTVVAPDGVQLQKAKLTKEDAKRFDKDRLDFEVAFTAASKGKKSFSGELRFAYCTDTDCHPTTEKIAFDVDVK